MNACRTIIWTATIATALACLSVKTVAEEGPRNPDRWDRVIIREAPVWNGLLSHYQFGERRRRWPETKAALEAIVREHGESRWADDAALCLACGKAAFEDDPIGAVADLRGIAQQYPGAHTIVTRWDPDQGYEFDPIWMMYAPGRAFVNSDGTVRFSRSFGPDDSVPRKQKEVLAYFEHLRKHPRLTRHVAMLCAAQVLAHKGDLQGAVAQAETLVAASPDLRTLSAADRAAAAGSHGHLIRRLWRPEQAARYQLMQWQARRNQMDKAIETGLGLVQLCSSDGWHWKLNRVVADLCADHGRWQQAAEQYRLALTGCWEETSEVQKRQRELGVKPMPLSHLESAIKVIEAKLETAEAKRLADRES